MIESLFQNPAVIAGLFTILGGVSLKLVESWLARGNNKIVERKDQREEIAELREQLDKEEADVALWRKKFFESEETNHKLRMIMIEKGWEELERQDTQEAQEA